MNAQDARVVGELQAAAGEAAGVEQRMVRSFEREHASAVVMLTNVLDAVRPALGAITTRISLYDGDERHAVLVVGRRGRHNLRHRLHLDRGAFFVEVTEVGCSDPAPGDWRFAEMRPLSLDEVARHYDPGEVAAALLRLCARFRDGNAGKRAVEAERREARYLALATLIEGEP